MAAPGSVFEPQIEPSSAQGRWAAARLVWHYRALLLRVAFRTALISLVVVLLIPKHYESTAQLMPPDLSSSSLDLLEGLQGLKGSTGGAAEALAGGAGGIAGKLLGQNDEGQVLIGVMRSQTLEDRIIQQFGMAGFTGYYHDRYIEDARRDLEDDVDIQEDRKSGIISINVTQKDPKRAADIAHAYVGELGNLMAEVSTSSARRERIFIEDRVKTIGNQLEQASRSFSDFSSKNTAIDIPEQGKAMVEAAALLQGQIIAAQAELGGLRQIYTENNARVKQTEAQIAELQQQLNKFGGKDVSPTHPTQDPNSLYPAIRELPLLGIKYADLLREMKVDEAAYEMLRADYEIAKVEEAKEIPSVQVLDPGVPAEKKSFPPRGLLVVLVMFLAASAAIVCLLARERWAELDERDERKLFLSEVGSRVSQHWIWQKSFVRVPWSFICLIGNNWLKIERKIFRGAYPTQEMP